MAKTPQEMATDIIVAWLGNHKIIGPSKDAAPKLGEMFKTLVKAISETSPVQKLDVH